MSPIRPTPDPDLRELAEKLTWNGPPTTSERFLSVFMDQNNRCNLRCTMCGFSDPRVPSLTKYDMPRPLFDRIAADLFPRATCVFLSLLTEPFMTHDFVDRLRVPRQYGVPFTEVITNGTLLTQAACEAILDAQLSRVVISIDGGTKEVYEAIRIGARFEQVIANFERLRDLRDACGSAVPALRVNHVLSEGNIDHFGEALALVERLRADEISVRPVTRMSQALVQQNCDPAFWEKIRAAKGTLRDFCARTGVRDSEYLRGTHTLIDLFTDAGEHVICRRPWTTLAIHPNGDAFPCMAWSAPPIGNLGKQTLDEIWDGPVLTELRRDFEREQAGVDCRHCLIRRGADDADDDFFYRKLASPLHA
jgi:radical SAM protein with 4Fe4S-binding SPASM domain